jgi:hypothetical protein
MPNRSNYPSCILSLIGDIGVTVTDIIVSKWADQSGSGNDAVAFVENSGPIIPSQTLNNRQILQIQGPLKVPLTSSPEYTFFSAVMLRSAKTEGDVFLGSNNSTGSSLALACGSAADYGAGWTGPTRNINLGNSDFISVGPFKLLSYVKKPSGIEIYCNGQFIRFVADTSVFNYYGDHNWVIGRECEGTDSYYFQGSMAELMICEDALNNGQRKKIEREIMAYWGL